MIKTLLGPIFKKYSRLIISMALITAFAIAVYSGLAGAYKSLEKSCDIYIDTYNYADVVITTNLTAANIKAKLEEIDGVSGVNQRLIYDTPARLENGRLVSGRLFYYQKDNFLDMYVWMIIGVSMIMGFIIVQNTTQTNLSDMKKELSVLRSLGFQVSDISKTWFIQTMCQFAFSLAAGLPLGKQIAAYVLNQMTGDLSYPFITPPRLFIFTSLIVFIYIAASHFSAMRIISKWDITENIKEKE